MAHRLSGAPLVSIPSIALFLVVRTSSRSTDPSTESTAPPRSAHVRLGDVPRTHDPAECRGRASSTRRRDDGDADAIGTRLRLSTATI